MKVLLTTDAVGGVWTHSLDLARGLAQQGVQVVLAVMGPSPTTGMRREAARVPGLRLEDRPYRLEWMDEPWEDVQAAGDWLMGLERSHQVDLVHSNSYSHGALGFDAPVLLGAHSCIHGWWEAVHGEEPPGQRLRVYREKVHEGLEGADLIVAPTAWMLRSIKRHYGPVSTPMRTIRNGRSPFAEPDHKEDLALWVGRVWDEAKNARLLDQAAGRGIPWRTRVIGEDHHPDQDTTVRLRHVEQTGRVSSKRLRMAYARAGVFVSTARYEPFGLGPLEAAQAGCALVLPRIGSLQETWEDDALFYKTDDSAELQHLLHELALDPDLHIRHCERARQRALDLTHHKMASDYLDAYQRLIDKTPTTHITSTTSTTPTNPTNPATTNPTTPTTTRPDASMTQPTTTGPQRMSPLQDDGHPEVSSPSADISSRQTPAPYRPSPPASARRPTRRPLDHPDRISSSRSFPANPFRTGPGMLPSDAAVPAARTRPTGPYRTDISRPAHAPEVRPPTTPLARTRDPNHTRTLPAEKTRLDDEKAARPGNTHPAPPARTPIGRAKGRLSRDPEVEASAS